MSSGPSSAHHVAQRPTSPAAATPYDQTGTWMSRLVAGVCHNGAASAQMIIKRPSWRGMFNLPHALFNVS